MPYRKYDFSQVKSIFLFVKIKPERIKKLRNHEVGDIQPQPKLLLKSKAWTKILDKGQVEPRIKTCLSVHPAKQLNIAQQHDAVTYVTDGKSRNKAYKLISALNRIRCNSEDKRVN